MTTDPVEMLAAAVRVPDHVVFRPFPAETVVLNLQTGLYHGLNPVAGAMLEALQKHGVIAQAADHVAAQFEVAPEQVRGDMVDLCRDLIERGLLEIVDAPRG